jgi:hypothetical protein
MAGPTLTERRSIGMMVDDGATQLELPVPEETTQLDTPDAPDLPDELSLARALVLRAHPEVVEELIAGNSLAELLASVPAAEAAFVRVVEATRVAATRESTTPTVPGGGAVRSAGDNVEGLGPLAKIRAGLCQS